MVPRGSRRRSRIRNVAVHVSGGVSDRVTDVDHAVVESSVVQQLEVESYASRQRRLAAADEDRAQQQHALVDQAVPEGLGRDPRASDAQVRAGASLSRRTASGSNRRSILVRAVDTSVREVE